MNFDNAQKCVPRDTSGTPVISIDSILLAPYSQHRHKCGTNADYFFRHPPKGFVSPPSANASENAVRFKISCFQYTMLAQNRLTG